MIGASTIGWTGGAGLDHAIDVGIHRISPSILKISNGSTGLGDLWTGTISATNLLINGQPIAQGDRITSGTTSVIATQDRSVTISTAGTQRVVIGENGRMGIGIAAPSYVLHVSGTARVQNAMGTAALDIGSNSLVGAPHLSVAAQSSYLILSSAQNDVLVRAKNNIVFSNENGLVEHVRILNTGNVGIGTTAPAATLQVSGSFIVSTSAQTTTPSLYVGTNGNVGIGTKTPTPGFVGGRVIHLEDTETNLPNFRAKSTNVDALFGVDLSRVYFGSVSNHDIRFITSGTSFPRMVVKSNGNVGIGTTNPTRALDVSGSANISGTVKVAGTGNEACNGASLGTIRFNPVTGAPQICVQR